MFTIHISVDCNFGQTVENFVKIYHVISINVHMKIKKKYEKFNYTVGASCNLIISHKPTVTITRY